MFSFEYICSSHYPIFIFGNSQDDSKNKGKTNEPIELEWKKKEESRQRKLLNTMRIDVILCLQLLFYYSSLLYYIILLIWFAIRLYLCFVRHFHAMQSFFCSFSC